MEKARFRIREIAKKLGILGRSHAGLAGSYPATQLIGWLELCEAQKVSVTCKV